MFIFLRHEYKHSWRYIAEVLHMHIKYMCHNVISSYDKAM